MQKKHGRCRLKGMPVCQPHVVGATFGPCWQVYPVPRLTLHAAEASVDSPTFVRGSAGQGKEVHAQAQVLFPLAPGLLVPISTQVRLERKAGAVRRTGHHVPKERTPELWVPPAALGKTGNTHQFLFTQEAKAGESLSSTSA